MKSYKKNTVCIDSRDLLELIHWARRYADGRFTWVPEDFNRIYDRIMSKYPELKQIEFRDEFLMENGRYFPYASGGEYDANYGPIQSGCF